MVIIIGHGERLTPKEIAEIAQKDAQESVAKYKHLLRKTKR